jgi:outer membrane lipoprotein-sorting protein
MRWCGLCVVGLLFAGAASVRADDQADGVKLVDAAIKASGGEQKLKKLETLSLKGNGKVMEGNNEAEMTIDASAKSHDRWRLQLDVTMNGRTKSILIVINGDMGWAKHEDKVEDAPAPVLKVIKQEFRALRMAQMLTPLKDKGVKLSLLGEVKINDRAALGLKAVQENQPDVDIYFDKETHLPVKCELRIKEPKGDQEGDKEITTTWLFSEVKAHDGVKHPMKIVLNVEDKKMMELELKEVKPGAKLEDNAFDKP